MRITAKYSDCDGAEIDADLIDWGRLNRSPTDRERIKEVVRLWKEAALLGEVHAQSNLGEEIGIHD